MMTIRLADWDTTLFGRDHGARVRTDILRQIGDASDVLVDLTEVEAMSLSFADECFGVLADTLGELPAPPHITFHGANSDVRSALAFVVAQRRGDSQRVPA
jgi:hypothetical protein